MSKAETKWVAVGAVGRAHGVRGEVYLRLTPGTELDVEPDMVVRLTREGPHEVRETTVTSARGSADSPIVSFAGIEGRESVAAWTLAKVEVPADALPELEEDEFYFHEVLGARLLGENGVALGTVSNVWDGGGRFYLVCKTAKGEAYLPVTDETLLEIRADAHEVVIDPAEMIYPDEVEA